MYDISDIRLVTFNVNGIRTEKKRRAIFNYLKNFPAHVILLQETHGSPEIEKIWSSEWGNKIIYSHGTNQS